MLLSRKSALFILCVVLASIIISTSISLSIGIDMGKRLVDTNTIELLKLYEKVRNNLFIGFTDRLTYTNKTNTQIIIAYHYWQDVKEIRITAHEGSFSLNESEKKIREVVIDADRRYIDKVTYHAPESESSIREDAVIFKFFYGDGRLAHIETINVTWMIGANYKYND